MTHQTIFLYKPTGKRACKPPKQRFVRPLLRQGFVSKQSATTTSMPTSPFASAATGLFCLATTVSVAGNLSENTSSVTAIIDSACNLCSTEPTINDGSAALLFPDRELPFLDTSLFNEWGEEDVIAPSVLTCESFERYLRDSVSVNDDLCRGSKALLTNYCGCNKLEGDDGEDGDSTAAEDAGSLPKQAESCSLCTTVVEDASLRNKTLHLPGFPVANCGALTDALSTVLTSNDAACATLQRIGTYCGCPAPTAAQATTEEVATCTPCVDGSYPFTRNNSMYNQTLVPSVRNQFLGMAPSCPLMEAFADSIPGANVYDCRSLQGQMSAFCGCPALPNHCVFCNDGVGIPPDRYDDPYGYFQFAGASISCQAYENQQYAVPEPEENACFGNKLFSSACGCRGGVPNFSFMNTRRQHKFFLWASRPSAMLSIIGSMLIIRDILRKRCAKIKNMYGQIMIGVSAFDIVSSFAWLFMSLASANNPVAEVMFPDHEIRTIGSKGNMTTCRLQGWLLYCGFTSTWMNVLLSVYYKLVIVNKWKESDFTRCRRVTMFTVAIIVGLSIAFSVVPFLIPTIGCHMQTRPWELRKAHLLTLGYGPLITYSSIICLMTLQIYLHVRKQDRKAEQWRTPESRFSDASNGRRGSSLGGSRGGSSTTGDESGRGSRRASLLAMKQTFSSISRPTQGAFETRGPSQRRMSSAINSRPGFIRGYSVATRDLDSSSPGQRRQQQRRTKRRNTLERKVFWQSILYVLAVTGCFPILLIGSAFTSTDRIEDDVTMVLLGMAVMLCPLQGFFNCFIYFRPRMEAYFEARRRTKKKRQQKGKKTKEPSPNSSWLQRCLACCCCWRNTVKQRGQSSNRNGVIPEEESKEKNESDSVEMVQVGSFRIPSSRRLGFFDKSLDEIKDPSIEIASDCEVDGNREEVDDADVTGDEEECKSAEERHLSRAGDDGAPAEESKAEEEELDFSVIEAVATANRDFAKRRSLMGSSFNLSIGNIQEEDLDTSDDNNKEVASQTVEDDGAVGEVRQCNGERGGLGLSLDIENTVGLHKETIDEVEESTEVVDDQVVDSHDTEEEVDQVDDIPANKIPENNEDADPVDDIPESKEELDQADGIPENKQEIETNDVSE